MISGLVVAFLALTVVVPAPRVALIDVKATKQTKALYANLKKLSKSNILFGHQHATEYGHGWNNEPGRSDVKSVVGSHPAVIGVDFAGICSGTRASIEAEKARLRKVIVNTYDRGGVITISNHLSDPVHGGGFNAQKVGPTKTVTELLPGGTHHAAMTTILADIADLAKSCKGKDGNLVPMIFRPWHELDGDWFWWGTPTAPPKSSSNFTK